MVSLLGDGPAVPVGLLGGEGSRPGGAVLAIIRDIIKSRVLDSRHRVLVVAAEQPINLGHPEDIVRQPGQSNKAT